jgi:hypothetical protein
LVRLLAEVGQSVLVVSYTHSAVDTLLCKLAAESTTGSSCFSKAWLSHIERYLAKCREKNVLQLRHTCHFPYI